MSKIINRSQSVSDNLEAMVIDDRESIREEVCV